MKFVLIGHGKDVRLYVKRSGSHGTVLNRAITGSELTSQRCFNFLWKMWESECQCIDQLGGNSKILCEK